MSSLSLSFGTNYTRDIPFAASEESEPQIAASERTRRPPPPSAGHLGCWRGKAPVGAGEQIEIRQIESSDDKCVIELHLPGREPGEPDHQALYQAVANQVWHHCSYAELLRPDKQGRLIYEMTDDQSRDGVATAVREVKTLIGFMQLIGMDISGICGWLNDPQLVSDLHAVFGPRGFELAPSARGETLDRDVVRRLAEFFAAADHRDLLLAMLDVALPRCPDVSVHLCREWIALANEAMKEGNTMSEVTQEVARRLLHSRLQILDSKDRAELTRLADPAQLSVVREPDEERDRFASIPSHKTESPTSSRSADEACSMLTPGPEVAARTRLGQLFPDVDLRENRAWDSPDLAKFSGGSTASEGSRASDTLLEDTSAIDKTLMRACRKDDLAQVKACIANNAKINATDECGQTPLILAARKGHREIVEYLIANGAMIDNADDTGSTALLWASAKGETGIVALLLSNDVNTEVQSKAGMTALMLASQHGHEEVVTLLNLARVKLNVTDREGRTAEDFARMQGHHELADRMQGNHEIAEELGHRRFKRRRIGEKVKPRSIGQEVKALFTRQRKKRKLKK